MTDSGKKYLIKKMCAILNFCTTFFITLILPQIIIGGIVAINCQTWEPFTVIYTINEYNTLAPIAFVSIIPLYVGFVCSLCGVFGDSLSEYNTRYFDWNKLYE